MKSPSSRRMFLVVGVLAVAWGFLEALGPCARAAHADELPFPVVERFENFTIKDGMPAHKIHAVYKASDGRLWVGTWNGLLVREKDGRFVRYGPEDGLSHKMVLSIVEHPRTGDLWIGTMRGLNRVSGGKIHSFTQTDSGLPNNVVYGVAVVNDVVWTATAAGAGAYDLKTKTWKIYDHNNSVMHEPWCYAVSGGPEGKVFVGVWGGGIIEHDPKLSSFKEYRDPDRDFHYDLVPNDGPINDITSWLSWNDGILWQCTYFGFAMYDGKNWKTWVEQKTPLPSNFTQFVWPVKRYCWIGMDRGASTTDGEYWVNYLQDEQGRGIAEIHRPGRPVEKRVMPNAMHNYFVLGIWADEKEVWFATSDGLTRGIYSTAATKVAVK